MDRVLRTAVALGLDPVTAIQIATINAADCYGLASDMGSISPGKCADIVLLDNLVDFDAKKVFIDGDLVAENGRPLFDVEPFEWPEWMTHTINLGADITPEAFEIPVDRPDGTARVRTIVLEPGDAITKDRILDVPVRNGRLVADPANDILKICVFDRHHGAAGTHSHGFITGFGIHGALAQTVAHDAHTCSSSVTTMPTWPLPPRRSRSAEVARSPWRTVMCLPSSSCLWPAS